MNSYITSLFAILVMFCNTAHTNGDPPASTSTDHCNSPDGSHSSPKTSVMTQIPPTPPISQPIPRSSFVDSIPRATLSSFNPLEPYQSANISTQSSSPSIPISLPLATFSKQTPTTSSQPLESQSYLIFGGISELDRSNCLRQSHCLICEDPTTTLACYKYNCQCQRGDPFAHYMPASLESCHAAELCMTCPSGTIPFTWGRLAVCLTVWRHRPVRGEGSPLTNWTSQGIHYAPVGSVNMGAAGSVDSLRNSRPQHRHRRLITLLLPALTTSLYIILIMP